MADAPSAVAYPGSLGRSVSPARLALAAIASTVDNELATTQNIFVKSGSAQWNSNFASSCEYDKVSG